jgi:hypothetical protein
MAKLEVVDATRGVQAADVKRGFKAADATCRLQPADATRGFEAAGAFLKLTQRLQMLAARNGQLIDHVAHQCFHLLRGRCEGLMSLRAQLLRFPLLHALPDLPDTPLPRTERFG